MVALLMSLNALAIDGMLPALDEMARELGAQRRQPAPAGGRRSTCSPTASAAWCPARSPTASAAARCCCSRSAAYALFSLLIALVQRLHRAAGAARRAGRADRRADGRAERDHPRPYEGDRMARLMSLVCAVFIAVPVIAPSLGQAVLLFAGWRWIFVAAGGAGACWRRCGSGCGCPRRSHPDDRQRDRPAGDRRATCAWRCSTAPRSATCSARRC